MAPLTPSQYKISSLAKRSIGQNVSSLTQDWRYSVANRRQLNAKLRKQSGLGKLGNSQRPPSRWWKINSRTLSGKLIISARSGGVKRLFVALPTPSLCEIFATAPSASFEDFSVAIMPSGPHRHPRGRAMRAWPTPTRLRVAHGRG